MGQMTTGLLYGCEAPQLPVTEDDPEPLYDLIGRWEEAKGITWSSKGPKIRHETEGGKDLLGVWVAVGGSGEDGVAYFLEQCVPLDQVPVVFAKAVARADKLWARFAAWVARNENLNLPAPRLWLTPCEVA